MSQHHPDAVEANIETHPVKLAIAITVGSIGLVIGIILLAYYAVGSHRIGETNLKANTPEAVARNIAPVTVLAVDPAKAAAPVAAPAVASKGGPAPVVPVAMPAATTAGAAVAAGGEGVYKSACFACHDAGLAGAPKTGDKAAWAPRTAKGKPTLYDHAVKGFNAMPAKGGQSALSDADVKAAVDFMLAKNK